MKLELSKEDARFLRDQLLLHLHEMQVEVAHTEASDLQHSLAADLTRLERIAEALERELREE